MTKTKRPKPLATNGASPDTILRTSFNLPVGLIRTLKHRAIDEGRDMQDIVVEVLRDYLKKKGVA